MTDTDPRQHDSAQYERHKERARERSRKQTEAGQDIGELPAVVDPERKARAQSDLEFYLTSYFPDAFPKPFSKDHRKLIRQIQQVILTGGLSAVAMPRGSGKTTIMERACIWAVSIGARAFVMLIGADADAATINLEAIRSELENNELLLEDWPELVYPIRELGGTHNKAKGQRYRGERTQMRFTKNTIVLPTIPGSKASGAILRVAGITSRIRGAKHTRADGRVARPDLVLADDVQTDKVAESDVMAARVERTLCGAVLGLAGPGQKIACLMACTVIRRGDQADRMLDRQIHPEWQGIRTKLVYRFPENEELWEEYARLRRESLAAGNEGREATEFYREHRAEMDRGAEVAWPERFNDDELSAIQHAMNKRIDGPASFAAEYQNEPLEDENQIQLLKPEQIIAKVNRRRRGELPAWVQVVTAQVDVHDRLLYFLVAGYGDAFRGQITDYGTFPKQTTDYFMLNSARVDLAHYALKLRQAGQAVPGKHGAIMAGLKALIDQDLMTRDFKREDGTSLQVSLCLIDEGYQQKLVHEFIKQSPHRARLLPSKGVGISATDKPLSEYNRKEGDEVGHFWRIPVAVRGLVRRIDFDSNEWKTIAHERLAAAVGDPGSVELFGKHPSEHRLLGDHFTGQTCKPDIDEKRGRTKHVWTDKPGKNGEVHLWDGFIGTLVAASKRGIQLQGPAVPKKKRRRYKLSEIQAQKRGR